MTHDLDLVKLKQMLIDGVPGRKIQKMTGIVVSAQVAYARAWGIERKLGRPRRTAEELAEAIQRLINRTGDTDVALDALVMTLRGLSGRLKSPKKDKLLHFASEISDLK